MIKLLFLLVRHVSSPSLSFISGVPIFTSNRNVTFKKQCYNKEKLNSGKSLIVHEYAWISTGSPGKPWIWSMHLSDILPSDIFPQSFVVWKDSWLPIPPPRMKNDICLLTKTNPKIKKCKKAKWLSEEALHIAEKRREAKDKEKWNIYPSEFRVPKNSKQR